VPEKELFAIVAAQVRAEYRRAILDPRPVQTGSTVLKNILGWFEPRVNFRPRVYFGGGAGTVLDGGRVGIVSGTKVAGFLYRWKGRRLVLIVLPAKKNPAWSRLPRKKWVALTGDGPTASIWRRGDFIYAVVGNAPVTKMRELSRAITPKGEKF
jgi:anti-sigma factor RsiW